MWVAQTCDIPGSYSESLLHHGEEDLQELVVTTQRVGRTIPPPLPLLLEE